MESTEQPTQFAQKISIEEYNRQKDDYTKKALANLNQVLQQQQFSAAKNRYKGGPLEGSLLTENINDNTKNFDDSEESDNEIEEIDKRDDIPKIVVQQFVGHRKEKAKGAKKQQSCGEKDAPVDGNLVVSLIEQHDENLRIIAALKKMNREQDEQINSLDRKLHFMKLELGNCQVDLDTANNDIKVLKHEVATYKNENKIMKDDLKHYKMFVTFMKFICAVLFLMVFLY